jgi:hypothetical protein
MADKSQSGSHAAPNKRGTLPVNIKRKQPFVLESFLCHAEGGRTKAKYQKNETIFRQGDSADAVFYIMDGKCKVTVVSEKGKEAVVALHEKGDFFGEGCLTGQPRRIATVTSITESEIMRLDKAAMVRALHDQPKFSELFMSHLLARNVRVEADLVDQLFNSTPRSISQSVPVGPKVLIRGGNSFSTRQRGTGYGEEAEVASWRHRFPRFPGA